MLEYITKQQAIDLVKSMEVLIGCTGVSVLTKGIEQIEGWISVEDKLPNNQANVIVAVFWNGSWYTKIGWHSDNNNIWYIDTPQGESETRGVTHWKPIPEPPKEE